MNARSLAQDVIVAPGGQGPQETHHLVSLNPELSKLPKLISVVEISEAMNITQEEFRRLAFGKLLHGFEHYRHFVIRKRSGGERHISVPSPALRKAQAWILRNILSNVPIHDSAMAYRVGRSVVDNARIHTGKGIVIRLDIHDFFHSIKLRRVREVFRQLGYNEDVSLPLALLTTNGIGSSALWNLPQGAPTSPALSNIVCSEMDTLLAGLAESKGFTYTRYADDLVFSHPSDGVNIGGFLSAARNIMELQGFSVNDAKTLVMRSTRRQTVTGLVVNAEPRVSRQDLRRFRAFLHRCETLGLGAVSIEIGKDAKAHAIGYMAYIHMVNPEQALRFKTKHSWLSNGSE